MSAEPVQTTATAAPAGEQGGAEGRTSRDVVRELVATGRGNAGRGGRGYRGREAPRL
jgi:hypothetical protein